MLNYTSTENNFVLGRCLAGALESRSDSWAGHRRPSRRRPACGRVSDSEILSLVRVARQRNTVSAQALDLPMRDYAKAAVLLQCPDEFHLTVEDVVLLTGYSAETVRQRRLKNFPRPLGQGRLLRWRLGDVKAWLVAPVPSPIESMSRRRGPAP